MIDKQTSIRADRINQMKQIINQSIEWASEPTEPQSATSFVPIRITHPEGPQGQDYHQTKARSELSTLGEQEVLHYPRYVVSTGRTIVTLESKKIFQSHSQCAFLALHGHHTAQIRT